MYRKILTGRRLVRPKVRYRNADSPLEESAQVFNRSLEIRPALRWLAGLGGEVLELENTMIDNAYKIRRREAVDVGNYAMFTAYAKSFDSQSEGKVKTRFLDWLIGVLKEWQGGENDNE